MGGRKKRSSNVEYLSLFDFSWQDDENPASPLPPIEREKKEDFPEVVTDGIFGPWRKEISIEYLQQQLADGDITQEEFDDYLKNKHPVKGYRFVERKNNKLIYQRIYSEYAMKVFFKEYFGWGDDKSTKILEEITPYVTRSGESEFKKNPIKRRIIEVLAQRYGTRPEKIESRLFFEYNQYRLLALAHVIELACHKYKDAPTTSKNVWGERFVKALQSCIVSDKNGEKKDGEKREYFAIYFLGNKNPWKEFLQEIDSLHSDAITTMRYLLRQDTTEGNPLYWVAPMAEVCKKPEHEGDLERKFAESGEDKPRAFYIINVREKVISK